MTAQKGAGEVTKHERPTHPVPYGEMERWFEDMFRRPLSMLSPALWPEMKLGELERGMPYVDMYEEGNELVLTADLPGIDKKDISISVTGNFLTITGERKKEGKVEKGNYFRYERSHGSFLRRLELPFDIDTEKIKAHLEKGILQVRLPKTEETKRKAKTIPIS